MAENKDSTYIQEQLQKVKALSRAGEWQKAKEILRDLPDTAEVRHVAEVMRHREYITTAELTAVSPDDPGPGQWQNLPASPTNPTHLPRPVNYVNMFFELLAIVITCWGAWIMYQAIVADPQASDQYSEATFFAVQAGAIFLLAIAIELGVLIRKTN